RRGDPVSTSRGVMGSALRSNPPQNACHRAEPPAAVAPMLPCAHRAHANAAPHARATRHGRVALRPNLPSPPSLCLPIQGDQPVVRLVASTTYLHERGSSLGVGQLASLRIPHLAFAD